MKLLRGVALLVVLGSVPVSPVLAQLPGEATPPRAYDPVGEMRYNAQRGAPSDAVREAQQALTNQGYYKGPLDGVLNNPQFRSALWNFQRAKGLHQTMRLDAATMATLELQAPGSALPRASEGFGATSRPLRPHDVEAP